MTFRVLVGEGGGGDRSLLRPQARGTELNFWLRVIPGVLHLGVFALYKGSWFTVLSLRVLLSFAVIRDFICKAGVLCVQAASWESTLVPHIMT